MDLLITTGAVAGGISLILLGLRRAKLKRQRTPTRIRPAKRARDHAAEMFTGAYDWIPDGS